MFCFIKKDTEDQVKDLKELLDSGAKLQIVMEFSETLQRFTSWYVKGSVTPDVVFRLDDEMHNVDVINTPAANVWLAFQHQPNRDGRLDIWVRRVKVYPAFITSKALTAETLEEAKLAVRDGIYMYDDGMRVLVTHPNIIVEVIEDTSFEFPSGDPDEDEDPDYFKDHDEDEDPDDDPDEDEG